MSLKALDTGFYVLYTNLEKLYFSAVRIESFVAPHLPAHLTRLGDSRL